MKTHIQIVAALHIALGALALFGALAVFGFLGIAGSIVLLQGETGAAGILGVIAFAVGAFLLVLALPGIIGGCALLAERSWARPVMLVLGILHLAHIPFGTALGVYTLWALLHDPQPPLPHTADLQRLA